MYGQYDVPSSDICVNLGVGQPRSKYLPIDSFNYSLISLLTSSVTHSVTHTSTCDADILQYGDITGYKQFRIDLIKFLNTYYNDPIPSENNIMVTNGITGALTLILSYFGKTGLTIYVEDPTYFLALNIFKDFGLNIIPIPIDEHGICVDKLEEELLKNKDELTFLYTIPFFQNPTGYCLSHNRLKKLIKLADKYENLLVLSDEVYHFLSFDNVDTDIKIINNPLSYYHERFISMGSFSKIFAPAMRIGWITVNYKSNIIKKLSSCGQLDSSGCVNPIGCALIHQLLQLKNPSTDECGYKTLYKYNIYDTIKFWKQFLYENCLNLYNSITTILKDHIEHISLPNGGYFLWVKLKNINVEQLSIMMDEYKIKFHYGNKFSMSKNSDNYIRFSFSWYEKDDYIIGITRLKNLIDNYIEKKHEKIKVCILGHKGKLGSLIVDEINKSEKYEFVKSITYDIDITDIDKTHIIVDVSSTSGTEKLLTNLIASSCYCPVIIGTTGDLPNELIKEYSKHAPIAVVSNFSKGIDQFKKIIQCINRDEWAVNMIEKHHINKKDYPSGTAKTLASVYGTEYLDFDKIESVREGEIIGEHEIILTGKNEIIKISHIANSRKLFAEGSLLWIDWIHDKLSGLYFERI